MIAVVLAITFLFRNIFPLCSDFFFGKTVGVIHCCQGILESLGGEVLTSGMQKLDIIRNSQSLKASRPSLE